MWMGRCGWVDVDDVYFVCYSTLKIFVMIFLDNNNGIDVESSNDDDDDHDDNDVGIDFDQKLDYVVYSVYMNLMMMIISVQLLFHADHLCTIVVA